MKKNFTGCVFISGLLVAGSAAAQQRLAVGITGGATLATLQRSDVPVNASNLRWGFAAGATGLWQPTNHWGLQTALLFVQQGEISKFRPIDFNDPSITLVTDRVRLNYLRLPVSLAYATGRNGQGLQLTAGPYAAVLVGGKRTFTSNTATGEASTVTRSVFATSTYENYYSTSSNDIYTRRLDFGLQGGAGYRVGHLLLQLQYVVGLRDLNPAIVPNPNGMSYSAADKAYSTRAWQASLTCLLPASQ